MAKEPLRRANRWSVEEYESALRAIRRGEVDAVVMEGAEGDQLLALHEFDMPYRALVEGLNESALALDKSGRITYCNPCFSRLIGLPFSEIKGTPLRDLLTARDQSAFEALVQSGQQSVSRGEFQLHAADGKLVPIRISVSPIPSEYFPLDPDVVGLDEPDGLVVVISDVTNERGATERLETLLSRIRSLAARNIDAQEQELARLSREIHNEMSQALTGLSLDAEWIERRLRWPGDPADRTVFERLRSMRDQLQSLMTKANNLATGIRPPALDQYGLEGALEWQLREFQKRAGIPCSMRAGLQDQNIEPRLALTVYRVIQEILTNVARHAGASRVDIDIWVEKGSLTIVARDNGRGISDHDLANTNSLGLTGMRERIDEWGGTLDIQGAPRLGTTVTVVIPQPSPSTPS